MKGAWAYKKDVRPIGNIGTSIIGYSYVETKCFNIQLKDFSTDYIAMYI